MKAKASKKELIRAKKDGLSLEEIRKKFGYQSKEYVGSKLRVLGYGEPNEKEKVKLTRINNTNTRILPITSDLIRQAGFNPDLELRAKRYVLDDKIVIELEEDYD